MKNITVGIVFADGMEYSPFEKEVKKGEYESFNLWGDEGISCKISNADCTAAIKAVKCGNGKVNAAGATANLISTFKPDYILNAGLSGAVYGLKRGDFVAGTSYIECDFDLTAIDYKLGVKPDQEYLYEADEHLLELALKSKGIRSGKLGTGDLFLTDEKKKAEFHKLFDICSFDMETAAIASVCHKAKVPFLSVRKISDDANENSLKDYREMNEREEDCLTQVLLTIINRLIEE